MPRCAALGAALIAASTAVGCGSAEPRTVGFGESCVGETVCVQGAVCYEGVCRELCNTDSDCSGTAEVCFSKGVCQVWDPSNCGDGTLDPGEGCDDGGTVDGDGCTGTCRAELLVGDFTDVAGANLGVIYDSDAIRVGPFVIAQVEASLAGGGNETKLRVNGTLIVGRTTTVVANDRLAIQTASPATSDQERVVTVTVDTEARDWIVSTGADSTPDPFTFTDVTGAQTGAVTTSNTVTLAGFTVTLAASVTGAADAVLILNGSDAGSATSVDAGDTLAVRMAAPAVVGGQKIVTVTVGSYPTDWAVGTSDLTPDPFSFANVSDVQPNDLITSNTITVAGISSSVAAVLTGAADAVFIKNSADAGSSTTVIAGDTLAVRMAAAATYDTAKNTTATVGTEAAVWTVTTAPEPPPGLSLVGYTGDGNAEQEVVVGFEPAVVIIKRLDAIGPLYWFDALLGSGSRLEISATGRAETGGAQLVSFGANGFTVNDTLNGTDDQYVAYAWRLDDTASQPTNDDERYSAGFGMSIVEFTGDRVAGRTVAHSLAAVPAWVVNKNLTGSSWPWITYHRDAVPQPETGRYRLNRDNGFELTENMWNDTAPTATEITVGDRDWANQAGGQQRLWIMTEIAGVRAFGTYAGNGLVDGPTVVTGFQPRLLVVKSTGLGPWMVFDAHRSPSNPRDSYFNFNNEDRPGTGIAVDFLSDGFKIESDDWDVNGDQDFMYWAER